MSLTVRAFAPANISCVFKFHDSLEPRWRGSYGIGFTLKEGVIVEVRLSRSPAILFNNNKIHLASVKRVIDALTNQHVNVHITSSLPLGGGFGLSGASALATAYAVNKLLDLGKTFQELAVIVHTADVESNTGLGDVTNQYYGGLLIKFQPSSQFVVEKLAFNNTPVYCAYYSKLSTKSIITNDDIKKKINNAADIALQQIHHLLDVEKDITFSNLITMSKRFAGTSGLLTDKKVIHTIESIEKNNGHASMIMLGNAVFSDTSFEGSMKLTISDNGAYLL